jgi:predicted HTH domain antitoxin
MKTLTINLPEAVESEEFELKMLLAGQLYERGKVTLGQAADIVGISKVGDSIEDLKADISNA